MPRRQMIYTNNGDFEEANDLIPETLNEIVKACKNGSVDQLETILNSIELDHLSRYLNATINSRIGSNNLYLTPLMIASARGHDSIVRLLLENYSDYCIVDAQNYSSDYDYDFLIYHEHFNKQTALWLAVQCEHLNVVETLISLGKANINHRADYSEREREWTPLGLACTNGQLEMVKYLIENGADLYNVYMDHSTSLMIASAYGYYDLVEYLLRLDSNLLNATNNNGSTALHQAADGGSYGARKGELSRLPRKEEDQTFDIVKLLLEEHQAKIVKDKDGFTPLTRAGKNGNEKLMKYFIENENQSFYTTSQIIDELELIGSYHMMWRWQFEQTEKAYHYLLWAMKLRYQDSEALILKTNLLSPMEAYAQCTECQTIKGLKSIKANPHRLTMECLLIWERQGVTSLFLSSLEHQAQSYENYEEYQRALQLYFHSYHLRVKLQIDLHKCLGNLKKCSIIMATMIRSNQTEKIQFDFFLTIFKSIEKEFLRNRNLPFTPDVKPRYRWSSNKFHHIEKYPTDKCLYIILNLIDIGIKIFSCNDQKRQKRRQRILRQYIEQLIESDYRTISDKKTLLHLSLMQHPNGADFDFDIGFPSLPIMKFLLYCRAPINARDRYHNTPLHELAANTYQRWIFEDDYHCTGGEYEDYTVEEMNDVEIIFNLLLDAGAHLDAVGQKGTPQDYAQHEKLQNLFRKHPIELNLKCICARIIQRSKLNYTNSIPERLQPFVQLH